MTVIVHSLQVSSRDITSESLLQHPQYHRGEDPYRCASRSTLVSRSPHAGESLSLRGPMIEVVNRPSRRVVTLVPITGYLPGGQDAATTEKYVGLLGRVFEGRIRRPIRFSETRERSRLHPRPGIVHLQRAGNAVFDESIEIRSAGYFHYAAQGIGLNAIFPNFAGLVQQRHARDGLHHVLERFGAEDVRLAVHLVDRRVSEEPAGQTRSMPH